MTKPVAWPSLRRDLVAILRGLPPADCESIVATLVEAGFEAIEIPLNSPDPYRSIATAARIAPPGLLIGGGTVLDVEAVDRLVEAGGRLLVSPNLDAAVLARARSHGMVTMPGVFSPTEALAAAAAGASALKFFPASVLGPDGIAAIRAVLPPDLPVGAVGGVSEADFFAYARVGIRHFGLGSSLYRPGDAASVVRGRADRAIAAYDAVHGGRSS